MLNTYEVDHATRKVKGVDVICRGAKLIQYNGDENLYALHFNGSRFYGGLGRPQGYSPAHISIYRPVEIKQGGNGIEFIKVASPIMRWDVKSNVSKVEKL